MLDAHIPIDVVRIIFSQLGVWMVYVVVDSKCHSRDDGCENDSSNQSQHNTNDAGGGTRSTSGLRQLGAFSFTIKLCTQ